MNEFAREIIAELLKTDIEVLEELRETWIEEVKRQGLSGVAVRFCEVALELVIEKKKEGVADMTKKDLLNNIKSNYGKLGIDMKTIEKIIKSGEKQGFTYSKIYAGIRLAMYLDYGTQEYFSLTEVAEIMGTSKEEAFKEMMRVGAVKPSSSHCGRTGKQIKEGGRYER